MLRNLRSLAVLTSLLSLGACGGGSGSGAAASTGVGLTAGATTVAFSTTQAVGTTSSVATVTLTNNTSATITLSSLLLSGANPSAFSETSNCPASLTAASTCTVWLSFGPATAAALTANLNIASNATTGTLVIALTGTGVAPAAGAANVAPVVVDGGPMQLQALGTYQLNQPFTTVTVCTPGSTTACQVIDHVLIDTGSTGLQLMAEVLAPGGTTPAGGAVPTPLTVGGNALRECHLLSSGYTYGSMVSADVIVGGYKVASMPVALISDAAAGAAPSDCAASANNLGAVATMGVNGILGIAAVGSNYDCPTCVSAAQPTTYYACASSGTCTATAVPLTSQAANLIPLLPADNNGVVISINAPLSTGSQTVSGTMTFGINTESNNSLGSTPLLTVSSTGAFNTTYAGTIYPSYLTSSAYANYFYNTTIPACLDYTNYYCPSGALVQNATLVSADNLVSVSNTFTVDNADIDFANYRYSALPGLGGVQASSTSSFYWGLPTFFGRSIFLLYTGQTTAGITGPAIGLQ